MRPFTRTYTPIASDADGIAQSQTPSGAGNLTLNGTLVSNAAVSLNVGQNLSVSCAGNDTGRTFTCTGTDNFGRTLVENLVGNNGSITNGTACFKTITSVSVDDATAGAVTVGVLGTLETPWIPVDHYSEFFNLGYHVDIGTATFTLQGTMDNIQDSTITPSSFTIVASGSSDISGSSTIPCQAVRIKVTAYTSGDIVFKLVQSP